jgi:hypothetical protein
MGLKDLPDSTTWTVPMWKLQKPRPAALDRHDRRTARETVDERESKKVRKRSGGQCEIRIVRRPRCRKRAWQIHHMIGGWGKRARGPSLLAKHKQHVCNDCHPLLTGNVLKRRGGPIPIWTDTYERLT